GGNNDLEKFTIPANAPLPAASYRAVLQVADVSTGGAALTSAPREVTACYLLNLPNLPKAPDDRRITLDVTTDPETGDTCGSDVTFDFDLCQDATVTLTTAEHAGLPMVLTAALDGRPPVALDHLTL